jgi:hypothetical protein
MSIRGRPGPERPALMRPSSEVQQRLRRYLLGPIDEETRPQLEQELLVSDDLFEELLIVEDEIIDDYLSGSLVADDRANFEKHFLSTPQRAEQLKFGRAFRRYVDAAEPPPKPSDGFLPGFIARQSFLVRASSLVVAIATITTAIWFFTNPRSSPRTFATLNLTISQGTRAEGPQVPSMKLPIAEDSLKIIMRLPEQRPSGARFRAQLETDLGTSRTLDTIIQDSQSVAVTIPAAELKAGQYSIKLFAVNQDGVEQPVPGSYLFTLE